MCYVFTHFYPHLLSKAQAERVEEFKTAQEIRRLKKLRKVESGKQQGIHFFFVPEVPGKKISTKKAGSK